jgi:hypothetical protein
MFLGGCCYVKDSHMKLFLRLQMLTLALFLAVSALARRGNFERYSRTQPIM